MGIESFNDKEQKEKKERSETVEKERVFRFLRFQKWKEILRSHFVSKKQLEYLKSAIERWYLGVHSLKSILHNQELWTEEIELIFSRIDEIESIPNVDTFLPKDFRVTKEEYMEALSDNKKREILVAKLTDALAYMTDTVAPASFTPSSMFFSLFARLDKNLILLQENTLDIRRSLH